MILDAGEITVRYAGARAAALHRVSCTVSPGRLVAVVGPNGSGKTTLLRALVGLLRLERGTVRLEGRPVAEWDRSSLAQVVAVVAQREEVVFPVRVAEAVMMGRYARLGPLAAPGQADRDRVEAALASCDVGDLAGRPLDSLSGGEWQRVRIARALAQEPRALLLDEPTASLDVRHEMELFELFRGLVDGGLAALVITHHLNLAARFADEILLLDGGAALAHGTPHEVLSHERLTRVFQWPIAVSRWADGSPLLVPLRRGESAE